MNQLSDAEIVALILMWGKLAPNEPTAYDARIQEAKWEVEHIYKIADFWKPDADEDTIQEYKESKEQMNEWYDRQHAR